MSISSFIVSAVAALLPLAGSLGPVAAQDQLAEPEVTQTAETEQSAPILDSGKQEVQRELALATQELGHEFVNIDFKDSHSAHLTFPETFNPDTDQEAVDRVLDALKINGYDNLTANY